MTTETKKKKREDQRCREDEGQTEESRENAFKSP
jgi:hypothetical protein